MKHYTQRYIYFMYFLCLYLETKYQQSHLEKLKDGVCSFFFFDILDNHPNWYKMFIIHSTQQTCMTRNINTAIAQTHKIDRLIHMRLEFECILFLFY